jgi:hypothetical protein
MSLGAALGKPAHSSRTAMVARIAPATSRATTHGKPRAASRTPGFPGATTCTGCAGAASTSVSRRLRPATCAGCTAGAPTVEVTCGTTTGVRLCRWVISDGETSARSEPGRDTRPVRGASVGRTGERRSDATRGAVGADSAAVVWTGTASSGAATGTSVGAPVASAGDVVSADSSATRAGGGSGAGAGCGAGGGAGTGCGEGAGGGGGAGAARGGSSVNGST